MTFITIAKLFLILTIAIKQSPSLQLSHSSDTDVAETDQVQEHTAATVAKLFEFEHYKDNVKELQFSETLSNEFLGTKPTGLQKTVLDLDFPEGPETQEGEAHVNSPKHRVVQCLAVGEIDYIQKKIYREVSMKLTPKDPYDTASEQQCTNKITVSLSPPGVINAADKQLTNVYKAYQKDVTLNKTESQVVTFENALDDGILDASLFWINFEITGKCSKTLEVELLRPQNNDLNGHTTVVREETGVT